MKDSDARLFLWQSRVRVHECDLMGVVYHVNYALYLDEARNEFLTSLKFDSAFLNKLNLSFSVFTQEVNYCAALSAKDQFVIETKMRRTSKIQFQFIQDIYRLPEKSLIAKGRTATLIANRKEHCLMLPEEMEALLSGYPSPD